MATNESYDASFSYSGGYSAPSSTDYYSSNVPDAPKATLRRRNMEEHNTSGTNGSSKKSPQKANMVRNLDFMFPKVDTEYTVQTDRGGLASLIAYGMIAVLALAECTSWVSQNYYNQSSLEHITVDTSLGKKMRVNMDVTFPALACEDLHVDIMDVAGDSQLDVEDTMVKKRLNRRGLMLGSEEAVETNVHKAKQDEKAKILLAALPADYCGPCYGAHETDEQCCNTCDELMEAYKTKRWRTDIVVQTAEQCIREGKDKVEPKKMRRGEGCNLQGHFMVNRVGGNFHIAMGEGVERDGRHIHTFNPEDTHNFNASHVIHHLSFGPEADVNTNNEVTSLNGVSKIVTKEYGTTGLFQYFIKIVPTTYMAAGRNGRNVETNRYFYTERFRPLMKDIFDGDDEGDDRFEDQNPILDGVSEEDKTAAVHAGHVGGHAHHDHHLIKKNSVLPGVFFIYEIYPFEVEVSTQSVPFTHLLIRLMATVGGVITMVRWVDSLAFSHERRR